MTYQRDPDQMEHVGTDPARQTNSTAERNEMRRQESTWGMIPGIVGIVLLVMLGFMLFSGDRTPTPNRTTSTETPTTPPKTTPTPPQ